MAVTDERAVSDFHYQRLANELEGMPFHLQFSQPHGMRHFR
ncbi:conserved hypothetical protein [delta proteobacterium NaphS2]|nr:conserved hypothetical protein [delta proteobacterium NaphS2]